MIIPEGSGASKWRRVTSTNPCPICNKSDWCSVSADLAMCRRVDAGAWKSETDSAGAAYYLHKLSSEQRAERALPPPPPSGPVVQRAAPETLDAVYSALLAALTLSPAHRESLQGRGLTDAEIDRRGYRSFPVRGRAKVVRDFQDRFGDAVQGVPGVRRQKDSLTLAGAAGLLIPVRDVGGRIVALKIRRDGDAGGNRYSYMSSTQHGGAGPGSPIHVPLGVQSPAEIVRLTEGELKADVAAVLSGLPTISIPGVGNWQPAIDALKSLGCKTVVVAMDMDAQQKPVVARALLACAEALIAAGFAVNLERWAVEAGKGIDDLLAAGKSPEVLAGDAALDGVHQIARAAGIDPTTTKDAAASNPVLDRLPHILATDDPSGLFGNKELLSALAKLSVIDRPRYAEMRALLRKAKVGMRDLDHVLKPIIAMKLKEQPPVLARGETGGFFESDGCICRTKLAPDGPVTVPLSNFAAQITDETIRDDGAERQVVLGVSGKLASGAELPRVDVPAETFLELDWVLPRWGADAIVWPGEFRALGPAIQALSGKKIQRTVYTHTGWRPLGNVWVYLHAGGAIGANGAVNGVLVDLPPNLARFVLPAPPGASELADAVRASLRLLELGPDRLMVPVFADVYRAPLGECDYSVHLAGPTGVFKSEVAALVSSADYSFAALRATRECVIAVPALELALQVVQVGNSSGRDTDKFAMFGLTPLPAECVTPPLVAECFANLECKVADTRLVNKYNLFVLEVLKAWTDPNQKSPKTIHHRGYGTFVVDGEIIKLKSKMR